MAVFKSYCPQFWGSTAICMARKTRYMFESYDQKLIVFAFYGRFHELLATVLGVSGRFAWLVRPDTCLRVMTKNSVFAFYGRFHELLTTVFGVSGRFAWLERPDTCLRVTTKNS